MLGPDSRENRLWILGNDWEVRRMDVRRGMVMTALIGMLVSMAAGESESGRRVVNFDGDWRFAKGAQSGAEKPGFDASAWQTVRLPHDWAIAGPFNPNENGYAGKLPWRGEGWYRKTFTLEEAGGGRPQAPGTAPASGLQPTAFGQRVYFDFDGVMAFPQVYVNGQLAGQWDYGYMSFRVDATPFVKFGADQHDRGPRGHPQPRHALVPRRRDLPQGDDDDLPAGARGALGHCM